MLFRSKKGAYSTNSRIAAFLSCLSAHDVDLVYTPGKDLHTADYLSRHPKECQYEKCQICTFVRQWVQVGDNCALVRSISIQEVLNGDVNLPYTQKSTWLEVQQRDRTHKTLVHLIQNGQSPDKRKCGGEFTRLKKLYNLFKNGELKIDAQGLVLIKTKEGHFQGYSISIPFQVFAEIGRAHV